MFCKNINKSSSFFAAIDYFQKALGVSEGYHRAKEGMEKAQKLLKQSKKRDYYKILGVARWVETIAESHLIVYLII